VESVIRRGRVTIDDVVIVDPGTRVFPDQTVLLDGRPLQVPRGSGVLLFKPAGEPAAVIHPGTLHVVMPLRRIENGAELLLADEDLARRVADPKHPLPQVRDGHRRLSICGLEVDGLAPGEWRPLSPRELERLRRSVRLPPKA
jgi:16S rRNA U516 pseudouridylate synthase RsuA-like enzyme